MSEYPKSLTLLIFQFQFLLPISNFFRNIQIKDIA